VTLKKVRGLVDFEEVSFSYDRRNPAVADLTFAAEPGETIALVGATGADKSTAMAALPRLRSASGKDSRRRSRHPRRQACEPQRNVGVIFQEPLLFNRSIAENLHVGNP